MASSGQKFYQRPDAATNDLLVLDVKVSKDGLPYSTSHQSMIVRRRYVQSNLNISKILSATVIIHFYHLKKCFGKKEI